MEFLLSVILLAGYFLKAIGLYSIAERRRIKNPWISWIPVINSWMVGCVSDQYRYVTQGESTCRRTWLLVLPVLKVIFAIVTVVAAMIGAVLEAGYVVWIFLTLFALICLGQFVLERMACYDLYRSCSPETAALFLVLGIVFSFLNPVFIFVDREKELGMPPRVEQHLS